MRRGGILILLLGLILIVGAVALLLFLQPNLLTGGGAAEGPTLIAEPPPIPEVEIVRARSDIAAGIILTNDVTQLEVVSIPQTDFNPDQNFSSIGEVEGLLTTRSFRRNEPLVRSALTTPGLSQRIPTPEANRPNDKAYPIIVDSLTGVADQIKEGDYVDVVATFNVARPVVSILPTAVPDLEGNQVSGPLSTTEVQNFDVTKTIVQRVQVLRLLRAPVDVSATPDPNAPVQTDEQGRVIDASQQQPGGTTTTPGQWTLVLAVTDQEAELIEFAVATQARITLVLRGAGDVAFEPTLGVTLDLLVAEFGLPLPRPLPPRIIGLDEVLTPEPTRTPAPTRVP
ncbi:MAG: Flp pilus assembly protein CpaB [Oscillochloridaceae bacterium umkhey_bin13]